METVEKEDTSFYGRFCQRTYLHGFADFYLAESKLQKAFWGVIMIGAFIAVVYYNYMLVVSYLSKPSATLIAYNDVEKIKFPNLTICSSEMFNATFIKDQLQFNQTAKFWLESKHLNETYVKTNFVNYLSVQLLNFVTFDNVTDAELIEVLETIYQQIFKPKEGSATNIYTFYHFAAFDCKSFLKQCSFAGKFFECCDFARPVITDNGVCYQMHFETELNSGAFQNVEGSDQGFDISINVNNSCGAEEDRQTRLNYSQDDAIILYATEYPSLLEYNPMLIPPQTHATVRIMATQYFVNQDTDECYSDGNVFNLAYREAYTTNLCRMECASNISLDECQCYDPIYFVTAPPEIVCTPLQMMNCVLPLMYGPNSGVSLTKTQTCINANCLKTCEYWLYEPSVLYSEINTNGFDTSEGVTTKLTVYYSQLQYQSVEEQLLMDTETFVSNVGGICGLWLGMSLMAIVQFLYILFCGPCEKRSNKKLKDKNNTKSNSNAAKSNSNAVYPIDYARMSMGEIPPLYIH